MSVSLPKLKRTVTPARTSRAAKRVPDYRLSEEGRRASSSESKSFLSAVGLGMRDFVQEIARKRRCDVLAKDPRGLNCVHLAVKQDDVRLLEILCEQCRVPPGLPIREAHNATAIHRAAKAGSLNALKYLIEKAKVNPHAKDQLGRNAVFYAAKKNHLAVVAYLVQTAKVSPKATQRNTGDTPLHAAARRGYFILAAWLVEKAGLDPHVSNNSGRNALHLAVLADSLDLVRFLHRVKDVNPHLPDDLNMTAVAYSAEIITRLPILEYFLSALGVVALLLGDPGLSRFRWSAPTAVEVAESQHNSAALKLISKARVRHSRMTLVWVNQQCWAFPRKVVKALAQYLV